MATDKGIFDDDEVGYGHFHSEKLCNNLIDIFNKTPTKPVIDFGCGLGDYVREFIKNGINSIGVDGNPRGSNTLRYDLTTPISLMDGNNTYKGNVLSLEVGEHIPSIYTSIYLENLINHCDGIMVISWAIRGQGGIGHVNCLDNHEVIDMIQIRGFSYNEHLSKFLREDIEDNLCYFRNTLMVFDKNENENEN